MTPFEIRMTLELRSKGVPYEKIAALLGRDVGMTRRAAHAHGDPRRVDFWTVAKVEQLRAMAARCEADDLSARDIARELGCSRNAVIGKAQRMGIELRHGNDGGQRSLGKSRQRRSKAVLRPIVKNEVVFELPPEPTSATWVRLVDTKDSQCRWPVGEPDHNMQVCGAERAHDGTHYCWHHWKRSVNRPQSDNSADVLPSVGDQT